MNGLAMHPEISLFNRSRRDGHVLGGSRCDKATPGHHILMEKNTMFEKQNEDFPKIHRSFGIGCCGKGD